MTDKKYFEDIRVDYQSNPLDDSSLPVTPLSLFKEWFDQAVSSGIREANAFTLATCNLESNQPQSRIVLMKELDEEGLVFYSNYQSPKGRAIDTNPFVSASFFWRNLERQVRWEGKATKVEAKTSDIYFASRPRGAQLGAYASPQSQRIKDRSELTQLINTVDERFKEQPIPRPEHWGGYRITPHLMEFWQGRPNRQHERIVYEQMDKESLSREVARWNRYRLAP